MLQDLADALGIMWDPPRDFVDERRERSQHRLAGHEPRAYLDLGVPAGVLDADPAAMVAGLRAGMPSHEVIEAALRKRALTFVMLTDY